MDISNVELSFNRRGPRGGSLIRDILAELRYWVSGALRRQGERRQPIGLNAIDDHLLRDIGLTRLGVQEATLINQNEASAIPTTRKYNRHKKVGARSGAGGV